MTQPRLRAWPFTLLVALTTLLWPFLNRWLFHIAPPAPDLIVPLLQVGATIGMVLVELAETQQTKDMDEVPRTAWSYSIMAAAMFFANTLLRVLPSPRFIKAGTDLQFLQILSATTAFIAFAGTIACTAMRMYARSKYFARQVAAPIGHTTDGEPIYAVIGYTPDGQPVTADRAIGVQGVVRGTNALAVIALVTGLLVGPIGVVFGHIALFQINRSGQAGRGLAIAGLVVGYIELATVIQIFAVFLAHH